MQIELKLSKPVEQAIKNFQGLFRKSREIDEDAGSTMILYNPELARIGHKASSYDSLVNSDKERLVRALWDSFDGIHWSTNQMFVNQLVARSRGLINMINTYSQRDFARRFNAREIGDSLTFDQWHFDVARLDPKSKTMPGLLLNHTRDTRTRTIQHYGVGFQIPSDWPMDPTKMGVYESHMEQMAQSINLTLDTQVQEVAMEGGLTFRFSDRSSRQPFVTMKDMSDALEEHCHRTFCIQKDGTAYRGLEMEIWSKLRNKGHAPDSVLLTADALQYNNIVNPEQGKLPKFGRLPGDDQSKQIDYTGGDDGIIMTTQHQGLLAVASRPYPVGTDEIKDNTITNVFVSERYELTYPPLADSDTADGYSKNEMTIGIVDGDHKKIEEISLMTALEESGIFPTKASDMKNMSPDQKKMIYEYCYKHLALGSSARGRKRQRLSHNRDEDEEDAKNKLKPRKKIDTNSLLRCYIDAGLYKHVLHQLSDAKILTHVATKLNIGIIPSSATSTESGGSLVDAKRAGAFEISNEQIVQFLNKIFPCLEHMRVLYDAGIILPFGMILFRPYMRFQGGSATFFGSKDKSMACVMKHCEVMYSNDPDAYLTKVQVRFTAGSVVTEKKSLYTATNICSVRYECGAGTRILPLFDSSGHPSREVATFISKPERLDYDIIPVLVSPEFKCETWYSSLTGKMPPNLFQRVSAQDAPEHYNMEAVASMLDLKNRIATIKKENTLFGHIGTLAPRTKEQFLCVSGATLKRDKEGKWVDCKTGRSALGTYCNVEDFVAICGTKAHHAGSGLRGATFNRPFFGSK
jgi:hypothetical protein